MLDPRVRKNLERSAGRESRLAVAMFPVLAVALFLIAAFDVYLAGSWGSLRGYSLASIIRLWAQPVDVDGRYSGFLIKALSRIDMAIVSVVLGSCMLFVALLIRRQQRQAANIIAELQQHGAWPDNAGSLTSAAPDGPAVRG